MSNILGTYQKTVSGTASQIVLADDSRKDLVITKIGTQDAYLGCNVGVTSSSGHQFAGACGAFIQLTGYQGPVWAITGAGTTILSVAEVRG